jgi:hypothetical protein
MGTDWSASVNPGMAIFRRYQRFQQGTDEVPWAGRAARGLQDLSIEALQNLPEWLKAPIRHGVGRVATNVVDPFGYNDMERGKSKLEQTAELFSPRELPRTLLSILQDRSAIRQEDTGEEADAGEAERARRPLFREYFDLPTQDVDNVYTHQGKSYRINPETKNEVALHVLNQFSNPNRMVQTPAGEFPVGALGPGGIDRTNMLSRFYRPGQPDPWDFAPHPEELERVKGKPLDLELFGRMLFEAIGKPATLETGGYYPNPPPNEEDIHPERLNRGGYQQGTANVPNPGLNLFRKQMHRKKKP